MWPPVRRGQGSCFRSEVGSRAAFLSRHCYGRVGVGRQKFRLLTSWGLSKKKKKKTSRCQDSREMFVDFLLHMHHFQLGFEANFFDTRAPWGGWGVHSLVACGFSGQLQTQSCARMMPELRRKWRELQRKQGTPGKAETEQQELKGKTRTSTTGICAVPSGCQGSLSRCPSPPNCHTALGGAQALNQTF